MGPAIRKFLPDAAIRRVRWLQDRLQMYGEFAGDRRRYSGAAARGDNAYAARGDLRNLEAQLTKDYHRIEKGLALGAPKRPFGEAVARRIDDLLPVVRASDPGSHLVEHVASARNALDAWNKNGVISDRVSPNRTRQASPRPGSREFFMSRSSVRHFKDMPVSRELVEEAVEFAINSPSVCNRQAWRVRVYSNPQDVSKVLAHQNGNSGFGAVPSVALVSVDLRLFAGVEERNQAWIDGGIFSMSLVWALHAKEIDSCMLNLSVRNRQADELRRLLDIPRYEAVVMMIAVGYGAEGVRVARSPHRVVESVLSFDTLPVEKRIGEKSPDGS